MTLVTAWLNKYYIKGLKLTGNVKMKPVFKLEGVTRTAVNLENYSKKEVCGQTRALHVSIKQSDEEDEKYYTYILSKINKTTFNYRCNHWGRVSGRRGVKCQATLSVTQIQCETLIDYLCNCSVYEPEPTVPLEKDPCSEFE